MGADLRAEEPQLGGELGRLALLLLPFEGDPVPYDPVKTADNEDAYRWHQQEFDAGVFLWDTGEKEPPEKQLELEPGFDECKGSEYVSLIALPVEEPRPEPERIRIEDRDIYQVPYDEIPQGQVIDLVVGIRDKKRRQHDHPPDEDMQRDRDVF